MLLPLIREAQAAGARLLAEIAAAPNVCEVETPVIREAQAGHQ